MKSYNEYVTLTTKGKCEFVNLTPNVKAAVEKSGIHEGLVLVSSLHSNAGVFVNDEEPGLLQDIDEWLEKAAPFREEYRHQAKFEGNASAHLKNLLMHHQVVVPLTEGKIELGPWQQVTFADFDGQRPRQILIKVMGE